jgi:acetyl-CoA acetyltransferase family protein
MYDSSFGWRFINPKMKELYGTEAMGETAENLVEKYNITREEQDEYAFRSQIKAAAAQAEGRFKKEIIPVELPLKKGSPTIFEHDEFIKPDTTVEVLSKLKPAFREGGSVTAGNSSGINDGSCAMLMASEEAIRKYRLYPKARIVSSAVTGVEPRIMGIGPVEAGNIALRKAGIAMKDVSIIELNEAFAAQNIACLKEWGLPYDDERINPNGGAIALGHPLGMSGARLLTTAAHELEIRKTRYALCAMCVGVGQGFAVVLERASLVEVEEE